MSSSDWNAISGQPQSADFLVPGKVNIEFADERTRRQTADTELHKLRDRLAQRIRYSKQVDEIALSLVASTSMDKSSCVDFSELKEALTAVMMTSKKADVANGFLSQGDTKRFRP